MNAKTINSDELINMNPGLISCVVPTLNSSATIEATLLCLKNQVRVKVELLVADSGSTDGTLEICQKLEVPTIYVSAGNMYSAVNAGLRQTNSEWIFYLNSDDLMFTDSLARLIDQGTSEMADVCYGNCDYIDHIGRFVYSFQSAAPTDLLPLFRRQRMGFAQQTAIYRRKLYDELDGFDESFRFRADADFFIRALLKEKQFSRVSGPSLACFRLHSGQFSNQGLAETLTEAQRIFGRSELRPRNTDRLILAKWQSSNIPHYLIRFLRESTLSHRLRLPRTIEAYDHK